MKKQHVAITGDAGFIGTHLKEVLGDDVVTFGWDLKAKRDIFELDDMMGVDTVVHLAALTDVQASMQDPVRYFWVNAIGTARMIEKTIQARARLIYISSAAASRPNSSPYAYSKFIAEQMVEQMLPALRGVILRPQNVYGKGMNPHSVMARFLREPELTIAGDGKHTRDFIGVGDVVRIIKYAILQQWEQEKLDIGTGTPISILQIAKWFRTYTGKKIVHVPGVREIAHSKANIKRLRELYPFELQSNLPYDIERLVKGDN